MKIHFVHFSLYWFGVAVAIAACSSDSTSSFELSEWRFPECSTVGSGCSENCHSFSIAVSSEACGTYRDVPGGCAPSGVANTGVGCFVRKSDHEVIITSVAPHDGQSLESCAEAGVATGNVPYCPDGGGP